MQIEFSETGLPATDLIKKAYTYTHDKIMKEFDKLVEETTNLAKEELANALEDINQELEETTDYDRRSELEQEKAKITMGTEMGLQMIPQMLSPQFEGLFKSAVIGGALILSKETDAPSEIEVAALFLIHGIKTKREFMDAKKEFGKEVTDIVASVQHIQTYPFKRSELIKAAPSDTKRILSVMDIASLDSITNTILLMEQQTAGMDIPIAKPIVNEDTILKKAQELWGNDKGLDICMVDAFNRYASTVGSTSRMEVGMNNELVFRKGSIPDATAPQAPADNLAPPPPPPKNDGQGPSDVF